MNTLSSPRLEATLSVVVQSALLSDPSAPQNMEALLERLQQTPGALSLKHLRAWLGSHAHPKGATRIEASLQTRADTALSRTADVVLAQSLHLSLEDGLVPWAWHHLRAKMHLQTQTGLGSPTTDAISYAKKDDQGYALVSLSNWHVASGQVLMQPARSITAKESADILQTLRPYFEGDGIELFDHVPGTWIARSPLFHDLPTASVERVMGQDVNPWLIGRTAKPDQQKAVQTLRRLQSEVQMLLYQHPINDAQTSPLNSIWFSATGQEMQRWPKAVPNPWSQDTLAPSDKGLPTRQWLQSGTHTVLMLDDLSAACANLDLKAWCEAFETIDQDIFSHLPQTTGVEVIFCGHNYSKHWTVVGQNMSPAVAFKNTPQAWWHRLPKLSALWHSTAKTSRHESTLEDLLI
jgi:hypothetical protein